MRRWIFRLYWWIEKRVVPTLQFSQDHYYELLKSVVPEGCSWLDLGCGHQMFAAWMTAQQQELSHRASRLIGIDLDFEALKRNTALDRKVFGNLQRLPFAAGTFDVVTANMVVEHLEQPQFVTEEVIRVLRPGGLFIFHTTNRRCAMMRIARLIPETLKIPLCWLLEARKKRDVFRTFHRMNTPMTQSGCSSP